MEGSRRSPLKAMDNDAAAANEAGRVYRTQALDWGG